MRSLDVPVMEKNATRPLAGQLDVEGSPNIYGGFRNALVIIARLHLPFPHRLSTVIRNSLLPQ